MKYFLLLLVCCSMSLPAAHAYGRKSKRGLPRTEAGLVTNVLGCLQNKDSVSYYNLFLPFDTLWRMVLYNTSNSPEVIKELNHLKEHPQSLVDFDPRYNGNIMKNFYKVIQKGEDSGVHWPSVLMQRYELKKETNTSKNLVGYEHIAPERFQGYIFIRDMMGRSTFCISIKEIQKVNGYFFGGQVTNILEATNIEDFWAKEAKEKKYFEWLEKNPDYDSLRTDSLRRDSISRGLVDTFAEHQRGLLGTMDEEETQVRKQVIDRKYYEGKFDNEIPVKMYIRYMKDASGKKIYYDGLYRFGDQKKWARLIVNKGDDGKWIIEDDPPVGSMELILKDKTYTGTWTNGENATGYDALLKQADLPQGKMEELERILEKGLSGSASDEAEKKETENDVAPETKHERKIRKKAERAQRRARNKANAKKYDA